MAKMGSFQFDGLKKLQTQLNKLEQDEMQIFVDACAKELAARLLAKVIKRTPVGDYSKEVEVVAKRDSKKHKKGDVYTKRVTPKGKMGGTLRRGWTSKTHEEAESGGQTDAKAYVDSLKIKHVGNVVVIEVKNPVEYASYVEYGHRTRNGAGQGWVEGKFMLTLSEQEVETIAPKVLEKKLTAYLKGCFGNDP